LNARSNIHQHLGTTGMVDVKSIKEASPSKLTQENGKFYRSCIKYSPERALVAPAIVGLDGTTMWKLGRVNGKMVHGIHAAYLVYPDDVSLDVLKEIKSLAVDINGNEIFVISGMELIALCVIRPQLVTRKHDKVRISWMDLAFDRQKPFYVAAASCGGPLIIAKGKFSGQMVIEYTYTYDHDDELRKLCGGEFTQPVHQLNIQTADRRRYCNNVRWMLAFDENFGPIDKIQTHFFNRGTVDLNWIAMKDVTLHNDPKTVEFILQSLSEHMFTVVAKMVTSYLVDDRTVYLCRADDTSPFEASDVGNPLTGCELSFSLESRSPGLTTYSTFIEANALVYDGGSAIIKYV
jgi:hypothetical protein